MPENISIDILGMTCASCVNRIEKKLKNAPGVISASVNLATEKAQVAFDSKKLELGKILSLIEDAGYTASISNAKKMSDKTLFLKKDKKIIFLSGLLTLPLVLPMLVEPLGWHLMPPPWLQLMLATPIQFLIGARFYQSAWGAIKSRTGNMELLVALGTSAAFGLSLYQMPGPNLYFESSAVVITLVLLGKFLEAKAKEQTTSAIKALQALHAESATILKNGLEKIIAIEKLSLRDLVVVRPGERIPGDGNIVFGVTHVDESLITGESLPKVKNIGDSVVGGSINGEGLIHFEVQAVGTETMLSRIIRLVEDAQAVKAPIQRLVDKVAAIFVPSVIVIAFVTIIATILVTQNWETAIIRGVAVLIIACPCALGLATPTSIMVGTGVAAKFGILIKNAESLELAHSVTTVVFDKTGTLTQGRPSISTMLVHDGNEQEFLSRLASIQHGSEHPLAKAVMVEAKKQKIDYPAASQIMAIAGKGIKAMIDGRYFVLGSSHLMQELGFSQQRYTQAAKSREDLGETVSYLANLDEKKILGYVTFIDNVKPNAKHSIQKLKNLGIKTMMLTGDNHGSAANVAKELGLDSFRAQVLPEQKSLVISELKAKGEIVAMIGDGINDAPALAASDVGIAMSTGTDVAMHIAGITLMQGDPLLIPDAIAISRLTYRKIKENLFWAFIYNIIGIPMAAFGLLNPMVAGAAMAMSSISVVSNALLLKRWKAFTHLEGK